MTFIKKFDSLKAKLAKADTKKFSENFAAQVNMTDEDCGGAFYIAFIDGTYSVEPFDYVDNSVSLTGSSAAVAKLTAGTLDSSIQVDGNAAHAQMIADAFKKAEAKKPAAKKPAAKKAPAAKKPAAPKAAAKPAEKKAEAPKAAAPKASAAKKPVAPKTAAKPVEKKAEAPKAAAPKAPVAAPKAAAKPATAPVAKKPVSKK